MDEFGIAQAQPVVNPTAGKIADLLRRAKQFGNQYEIKDYVPFFGGTGIGDLFLGQAPEEVNRWSYGDYPFRNPSSVVGTGGNRLDVWKTGRFEPTFDVVANVALPAVGTAQMTAKPLARALGPKAAEMAENYLTKTGAIANITEPSPVKMAEALRQPTKNELGFYSPLDEAVMNLQNPKGTGQQYLAQLLKTQGVKQEEVSTRGLDTFLTNNPKVSREQIAQYLRENPVTLKEKVLDENYNKVGTIDDYQLRGGDVIDDTNYMDDIANDEYFRIKNDDPDFLEELRLQAYNDLEVNPANADLSDMNRVDDYVDDLIRERSEQYARDVYYDNPYRSYYDDLGYEVSGNDDVGYYIKDPQGREVSTGRSGIYDISDAESRIREDALERGLLTLDQEGPKYADYVLPNGENYREVLIQYEPKRSAPNYEIRELPESSKTSSKNFGVYEGDKLVNSWFGKNNAEDWVAGQKANYKDYGNYESGHFDEPNILAHMRVTDRTIDGKKTLFVEEIQSDWHQTGRKKGYTKPVSEEKKMEIRLELDKIDRARKELYESRAKQVINGQPVNESFDPTLAYLERQEIELRNELKGTTGVPDAPFKKNWQELAMKRAMQMAAEGGYDRVAFTTGKQQASRYSLSKQIDSVDLIPSKEGDKPYVLQAWKNGNNVIRKAVTEDELPDLIGKEAAKKLIDQEPTSLHRPEGIAHGNPNVFVGRELSGLDLDVGGEGMKGFYDKILPDFINKYGKKHGLKVGQTNLGGDATYADYKKYWNETDPSIHDSIIKNSWNNQEDEMYDQFIDVTKGKTSGDSVHYFDLTPKAKESFLSKGQPLFAVPPAMAITDEDSRRDMLEKLFNNQK
jgi:hypothetical protein